MGINIPKERACVSGELVLGSSSTGHLAPPQHVLQQLPCSVPENQCEGLLNTELAALLSDSAAQVFAPLESSFVKRLERWLSR